MWSFFFIAHFVCMSVSLEVHEEGRLIPIRNFFGSYLCRGKTRVFCKAKPNNLLGPQIAQLDQAFRDKATLCDALKKLQLARCKTR